MSGNIPDVAAKLTKAQRDALVRAPSTPLGNVWLTCSGATKAWMVRNRLATGHGQWCTLTDEGKAVRAYLSGPVSPSPNPHGDKE